MSVTDAVIATNTRDRRKGAPKANLRVVSDIHIEIDESRNELLTEFGKTTLEDRYLAAG